VHFLQEEKQKSGEMKSGTTQQEVRQGIQELRIESPVKRLSRVTEQSHEHHQHSNEKTMIRSSSANARMNDSSKLLSDEKMNYTLLVEHEDAEEISELAVLGTPRPENEMNGGWTLSQVDCQDQQSEFSSFEFLQMVGSIHDSHLGRLSNQSPVLMFLSQPEMELSATPAKSLSSFAVEADEEHRELNPLDTGMIIEHTQAAFNWSKSKESFGTDFLKKFKKLNHSF